MRDNHRAWASWFTNPYKLKFRIWFWEEYIHVEQIYRYANLMDRPEILLCFIETDMHTIFFLKVTHEGEK